MNLFQEIYSICIFLFLVDFFMIPKIVHYCWLSEDPIPADLQKWMQTWQKVLPDYEFVLWDKKRFDINSVTWVKEAFDAKKYAYAADYIRHYAVYSMGGIYMDMDVEVVRPFGSLLNRRYMLGSEVDMKVEAGVFGAEKGCEVMRWCMDWYEKHHFVLEDGTLNLFGAPRVFEAVLKNHVVIKVTEEWYDEKECIRILPYDYLTAKSCDTGIVKKTKNTRTVHHFAGSWLTPSLAYRIKRWVKVSMAKVLGEKITRWLSATFIH